MISEGQLRAAVILPFGWGSTIEANGRKFPYGHIQLVAITSSSCMGLVGFCGLLWRLTGTIDFVQILINLKLFVRVFWLNKDCYEVHMVSRRMCMNYVFIEK